jgi:catechol 2,3-dioxygenase-like lactoylglutathione lyase family enzyme
VYISDMDRAVAFYAQTLGLQVAHRAGDHFCMIDGGDGLMIGLHPSGPESPRPGARGGITLGFTVARPIEEVVRELERRGVRFRTRGGGPVVTDGGAVKLAFFSDPDGNDLYLCQATHG